MNASRRDHHSEGADAHQRGVETGEDGGSHGGPQDADDVEEPENDLPLAPHRADVRNGFHIGDQVLFGPGEGDRFGLVIIVNVIELIELR